MWHTRDNIIFALTTCLMHFKFGKIQLYSVYENPENHIRRNFEIFFCSKSMFAIECHLVTQNSNKIQNIY